MANWKEASPSSHLDLLGRARDEHHHHPQQQQQLPLQSQASSCSPPVSMSLRTRESSAMALKHIFDQIQRFSSSKAGAEASNYPGDGEESQTAAAARARGGFQALRNHSVQDLPQDIRMRAVAEQDLDFTSHKPQQQQQQQQQQQHGHAQLVAPWLPPQQPASFLHNPMLLPTMSRPSPLPSNSTTAQLTIFYSGTVNVYNNVPADKAQAIMLLAGTGNPFSSNSQGEPSSVEVLASTAFTANPAAACPLPAPASGGQGVLFNNVPGTTKALVAPQVSPAPCTPSMPSSPSVTAAADQLKPQLPGKRPHSGIELPHARKASLARFLEKRKDRVQLKQTTNPVTTRETCDTGAAGQTGDSAAERSLSLGHNDKEFSLSSDSPFQESYKKQRLEMGRAP